MYAYCLFCNTQRCDTIAALLEQNTDCLCISPKIVQRKWIKGVMTEQEHPWLPGYIFMYTDEKLISRPRIPGIIRWLGNSELEGVDYDFALMIRKREGMIRTVKTVQEGDRVKLADPAWDGLQGRIIRIDRGRKRCCIEYEFDHSLRTVWVGYDLLSPAENPFASSQNAAPLS